MCAQDEGHKIKNPKMKLVECLRSVPVRMRLIISGTPIQNNLMEMHALFDFTTPGLLGDARAFKKWVGWAHARPGAGRGGAERGAGAGAT